MRLFFVFFFAFYVLFTTKNNKKEKKIKKNAKKFAHIKKKYYLCSEFKKQHQKETQKKETKL